ncbi:3-keto-5-aminohexanoate cleavage protein [Sphingomonas canadensis]|uniref:3-keto-5-aminohexanoate cleavage protein n=1 Tax=Sphingomonas canadensis TaxID=1219257 RepID=A0ABW3H9K0_9SPHN|nr:3-keto-5-aminohexanoate cleavage protein [Sphingomonas canadensis]MCW3836965.1 3-keto-5-aminohexanoate cleavage protein [Sphingomonas canadensis]
MQRTRKVVITCAVTGSIHTPTMSDHLPITADQITTAAVEAAEAGASVIHLHARDPRDGRPSGDPALFMDFLPRIKQQTNAVLNITTGHGPGISVDERLLAAKAARPELASLNMGSFNAGVMPVRPDTQWKHEWEKPYLEAFRGGIAANSYETIERILTEIGLEHGTRFEYECYDIGHLYALAYFAERGLAKPPFFIQCIFGLMGGAGADPENLTYMVNTANKLFGDDYYLSVFAAGRHQMRFVTLGAIMGGSVRVGLEDSLYIGRGELATSNAQQVGKVRSILEALSFDIAGPDDVREMLSLKGAHQTGF